MGLAYDRLKATPTAIALEEHKEGEPNHLLNRIEADTDPRNVAATRTLEKLEFMREGLLRERWITNGQK